MDGRIVEPAPYDERGTDEILLPHMLGRSLLMKPVADKSSRDKFYTTAGEFWGDAMSERLIAGRLITLSKMRVFEWFPRNPGLYFTAEAADARADAMHYVMDLSRQAYAAYQSAADAPPDHASLIRIATHSDRPARTQVLSHRGKKSMLQGGIGCVRYKPVRTKDNRTAWFMSATNDVAPDAGVPLLVDDEFYQDIIDRVRERGFATCTLKGRVKVIPDEFRDVYATKYGLPRLYVEIEEISDEHHDRDFGLVSVASSFLATIDGEPSIYAAYVTFDPGHVNSRNAAARWMREEYVAGIYNGHILTDFDQQAPIFADTLFSLNDVMASSDLAAVIQRLRQLYGRFDWSMLERRAIVFND